MYTIKYASWFSETSTDSKYTISGETISSGGDFLALLGPHKVRIFAIDNQNSKRRELFSTEISDDGGKGNYKIKWTENGFEITFSGSEQTPVTHSFEWEGIFSPVAYGS